MWQYSYHNDNTAKDMKMEIKWIVVEGIRNAAKECTKCQTGLSKEGSYKCETCPELFYFDTNKVII